MESFRYEDDKVSRMELTNKWSVGEEGISGQDDYFAEADLLSAPRLEWTAIAL